MKTSYLLKFDIQSDWLIATGREGGAYADITTIKDNHGLPYLPGKSIKGLLREAFTIAEQHQWFAVAGLCHLLFGDEQTQGIAGQGILQISSARLSETEEHYLTDHPMMKSRLYRTLASTAIDQDSGIARSGSLRKTEVSIPMALWAHTDLNAQHPGFEQLIQQAPEFGKLLESVLPLITELGGKRHRGLGTVQVSLETNQEVSQ